MTAKRSKQMIGLMVPPEARKWIEEEAGRRRVSMSDLVYALMTQGIAADTIETSISRLEAVVERAGVTREVLRQSFATRYMVEQMARGAIKAPETIGYDANQFADKELAKVWPAETVGSSR